MTDTDQIVEDILKLACHKPGKDLVSNIQAVKLEITAQLGEIMDQHRQGEIDRKNGEYWKARGEEEKPE